MRKNIKRKFITMATALMFSASVLGHGAGSSYADDTTDGSSTQATGDSASEEDTEAGGVKADILDDDHGRISFWEWKRMKTDADMASTFSDGKFHACMFVYGEKTGGSVGVPVPGGIENTKYKFISCYSDRDHIYLPRENVAAGWYTKYDRLVDVAGDQYNALIDKIYGSKWLWYTENSDPIYFGFDQYSTFFFKMDEDGLMGDSQLGITPLIIDQDTGKFVDKFFTTGGSMGVPFVKAISMSGGKITGSVIAISDGTAKSNPADMSYLAFGDRASRDHIYLMASKSGLSGEKNEPITLITDYYPWFEGDEYNSHKYAILPWGNSDDRWFCITYEPSSGQHDLGVVNGWLTPLDREYTSEDNDLIRLQFYSRQKIYEPDAKTMITENTVYNSNYLLYVGTQHVFASLKGEGGDPDTGEGGITTIGKGQMLIVGDATYMDQNNKPAQAEGIVLPEGSKIIVNEGGVLSIDGNFINNGELICNGGTIIVKDGGCISPYRGTSKGTITMNGGDMIIMPGAKVYALADEITSNSDFQPSVYATNEENEIAYKRSFYSDTLQVLNGGNIVNYGSLVSTRAVISEGGKIETRSGGISLFGVFLKDNSVLLRNFGISAVEAIRSYRIAVDDKNVADCSSAHSAGLFLPGNFKYTPSVDSLDKGTMLVEKGGIMAAVNGNSFVNVVNTEY